MQEPISDSMFVQAALCTINTLSAMMPSRTWLSNLIWELGWTSTTIWPMRLS